MRAQSCPTLWDPTDCSLPGSSPWYSPDEKTGMDCHFLLQGIFLTQRSNCLLLHWQADSLLLTDLAQLDELHLQAKEELDLIFTERQGHIWKSGQVSWDQRVHSFQVTPLLIFSKNGLYFGKEKEALSRQDLYQKPPWEQVPSLQVQKCWFEK